MAGLIWEILKYRDARRDRAVQEQQSAQKAEMEFRMKVAEKTENWPAFNRWVKKTYPEADIEDMPQLKVGGVTKKVPVTADAARGDIATKEVVEGGVTVTPETKEKFGLADLMEQAGIITPEQKTEYLSGVKPEKPSTLAEKFAILSEVQVLPKDNSFRQSIEKMIGGLVERKKAPKVQTVGVPGKPGMKRDIEWNRKRQDWDTLTDPYYPSVEGKEGKEGKGPIYSIAQRLDDLRATYKMKLQGLDREFGYEVQGQFFIKPESMEVYKAARERIMREYFEDERLVRAGKKPKYLEEPTEKMAPPSEIIWKYVPGQGMVRTN